MSIKFVCLFSGGITSWAAAKHTVQAHGTDGVVLLFADTLIEDEDNYRFLDDAARNIGVPITRIADGRTPWEVFRDERFLGNSRVDPCSKLLKRKILDAWREHHAPNATVVVGLSCDEEERFARFSARMAPVRVLAPLISAPLSHGECLEWARQEGLTPPRLYALGFPHANCGGFCVKAGIGAFTLLLKRFPARYLEHEAHEEAIRALLGDVSILRDRRGGTARPLTLRALRLRLAREEALTPEETHDLGGCGCALGSGGER